MQVLKPAHQSIHTEDSVAYVVRLNQESFETLKIITDKNEQFVIESDPKRDTYCQSVPLHPGSNNIRVRVYSGNKKVGEEVRSLYRSSPLSKADK